MKKKIVFICIIFICFFSVGLAIILNMNNKSVSQDIIDYYNNHKDLTFQLKLTDFTDFEWDHVIIYKNPVTEKDIYEITGIDYHQNIDLQSGMIFIKDKEIVYEEVFQTDFESPYVFVIYPDTDVNSKIKVHQFSREQAVFQGEKIIYDNENRYVFKPITSIE